MTYRALSPHQYHLTTLDALSALYDRRSGQTHLVAAPVPEILAIMKTDALSPEEIVSRLAVHFDLVDRDDAVASVTARLDELIVLGLVEKLS